MKKWKKLIKGCKKIFRGRLDNIYCYGVWPPFFIFKEDPLMMVSEERIKTNLLLMDELDYWDELTVKAINDEWTLRYYNHIMNLLNSQVDESIKWLESDDAKELFYEEAEYQHELFRALEDQWDEILENKVP